MHALFLTAGVDWHDPRIHHDDDAYNLVLLLKDGVRDERNDVGCLVLAWLELDNSNQQVAPLEHSAATTHHITFTFSYRDDDDVVGRLQAPSRMETTIRVQCATPRLTD